jgi:hypothetical protein
MAHEDRQFLDVIYVTRVRLEPQPPVGGGLIRSPKVEDHRQLPVGQLSNGPWSSLEVDFANLV